ncbi:MAG TPA: YbaB/EbfC family nucleoid-associated protein [Nocardioidaceae bacterium]|nr:YbaB/EbfC family nucleoid-associated protein [Nocardioidaceae bacterium]
MFPGSGDQPDMNQLLEQAQQMQQQLMEAQQKLAETRVEGSSGGGLVTATVTGTGDLTGLEIKPEACDPADTETLADLVVAAVQNAVQSAHEMAAQQLGPLAGGLGGGDAPGPGGGPQLGF